MTKYSLAHPDASATREHMEYVVATHGGIKVLDYKIARLIVETDDKTITSFGERYPSWIVDKVTQLDINRPRVNFLGLEKN